jgi:NAD(P)-dependent dehydrogenase (short-subunit alcohol dehydrogenase family)
MMPHPGGPTPGSSKMKTVLLTGATRGLGLAIARALDEVADIRLVLAVRDVAAGEALARTLRRPARVVALDLAQMGSVMGLVRTWNEPLHALVNNAGLQLVGPTVNTEDGLEATFAVNHLAPTWLAMGLLPWLRNGRVIGVGSGTHNPNNRGATMFGFRGGRFTSVEALARGASDATSDRQRGLDRYATSKLAIMTAAMALDRRVPETRFVTFDPGLMPGTGLARTGTMLERFVWSFVLRGLVPFLPEASTPSRSAAAARWLVTTDAMVGGEVYGVSRGPSSRVWEGARDPELARTVLDETIAFMQARWPLGDARSQVMSTR